MRQTAVCLFTAQSLFCRIYSLFLVLSQEHFLCFFLHQIRFGDLKLLPKLTPALKTLFAEEIGEMEERREKRELRHPKGGISEINSEQKMTRVEEAGRGAKRNQEEAATHNVENKRLKAS